MNPVIVPPKNIPVFHEISKSMRQEVLDSQGRVLTERDALNAVAISLGHENFQALEKASRKAKKKDFKNFSWDLVQDVMKPVLPTIVANMMSKQS